MRRYGISGLNPAGMAENIVQCAVEVWDDSGWHSYQCSRRRGHGPDGLYCSQHGKMADAGRFVWVPEDSITQGADYAE